MFAGAGMWGLVGGRGLVGGSSDGNLWIWLRGGKSARFTTGYFGEREGPLTKLIIAPAIRIISPIYLHYCSSPASGLPRGHWLTTVERRLLDKIDPWPDPGRLFFHPGDFQDPASHSKYRRLLSVSGSSILSTPFAPLMHPTLDSK